MSDRKLDILLHEHLLINRKIDDFINAQFMYISTILTLATSFIFIAYQSKEFNSMFYNYVQFLPYLFLIIVPTFMFKFNRAILLHGYRCFLEENINIIAGKNILVGAYLVKRKLLGRNPFSIMNYIIMILLVLTSIYFCHIFQLEFWNLNFIIQLTAVFFGIVFFIIYNNNAFIEGYNFGKKLYNSDQNLVESSLNNKN